MSIQLIFFRIFMKTQLLIFFFCSTKRYWRHERRDCCLQMLLLKTLFQNSWSPYNWKSRHCVHFSPHHVSVHCDFRKMILYCNCLSVTVNLASYYVLNHPPFRRSLRTSTTRVEKRKTWLAIPLLTMVLSCPIKTVTANLDVLTKIMKYHKKCNSPIK